MALVNGATHSDTTRIQLAVMHVLGVTAGLLLSVAVLQADRIDSQLNQPIHNSVFTFYGASGRGACGLDVKSCSAAGSGELFEPSGQWVPSSLPDGRYILNDSFCRGICVKVEYQGRT